uniref:Uncharacterized protein n=1 Tax=Corethron hystrix TaxID=216773 RepID=A0A7S1BNN7_9STRA
MHTASILKVCHQGFLESHDDESPKLLPSSYPRFWETYLPCSLKRWCQETGNFDCTQEAKIYEVLEVKHGPLWRYKTGRRRGEPNVICSKIELSKNALSYFQYVRAPNNTTTPEHHRYSPIAPYGNDDDADRQVALVELYDVSQGAYRCSNGGTCVAPDTCRCAR